MRTKRTNAANCDILGLGDPNAEFRVYIGNRPHFEFSLLSHHIVPLMPREINAIGQTCGNGWRKVFNIYAKLIFALCPDFIKNGKNVNWQNWRDQQLLQANSNTALLFETYTQHKSNGKALHIIMGRTYAKSLVLPNTLEWLDHEFAIDRQHKLIVCPYFDYRQLSNIKIIRLVELIKDLPNVSQLTTISG